MAGAPLNAPLELTSTYVGSMSTAAGAPVYGRSDNATWEALESAIGTLEGAPDGCVAFSSGMAAVAAVLELVPVNGLLVVPPAAYNTTLELARRLEAQARLRIFTVDPSDLDAVRDTLEPGGMVWVESPSNPLLEVVDIEGVVRIAREVGATTVADNTFATPLLQRPLTLGVDVVVHSVTKYLAGHSDLLMGAVVTRDTTLREEVFTTRRLTGAVPGPFEAWLALRGLRTLDVRLERSQTTARELARRLAGHKCVGRVRFPGSGGMISIEVIPNTAAVADRVVAAMRLWTSATSLGGVESLAERRRRHANEPTSVPESLIRLSVGLEHVDDLWEDLAAALEAIDGG